MREIKFRAWDTIDKRMRYENDVEGLKVCPSLLAVGFHGLPICIDQDSVREHEIIGWNRDHNLILMQFTGLEDRNTREIYDGDVVEQHRDTCVIESCIGGFCCLMIAGPHKGSRFMFAHLHKDHCKVIGTIYENPDFMEAQSAIGSTE